MVNYQLFNLMRAIASLSSLPISQLPDNTLRNDHALTMGIAIVHLSHLPYQVELPYKPLVDPILIQRPST